MCLAIYFGKSDKPNEEVIKYIKEMKANNEPKKINKITQIIEM